MGEGTCIWFKNTYGYLGLGMYTNCSYEGQIYVHYKNIVRKGLRDPKYRELQPGDVVEFTEGTGFFNNGSQAIKVKVKYLADNNDERQGVQEVDEETQLVDQDSVEETFKEGGSETFGQVQEHDDEGSGPNKDDEASQGLDNGDADKKGRSRPEDTEDS